MYIFYTLYKIVFNRCVCFLPENSGADDDLLHLGVHVERFPNEDHGAGHNNGVVAEEEAADAGEDGGRQHQDVDIGRLRLRIKLGPEKLAVDGVVIDDVLEFGFFTVSGGRRVLAHSGHL